MAATELLNVPGSIDDSGHDTKETTYELARGNPGLRHRDLHNDLAGVLMTFTHVSLEAAREFDVQWVHDRLRRDCYAQVTPNLLRLAVAAIVDCRMGFDEVTPSKVSFCYYPTAEADVKITVVLWVNRGAIKSAQRYLTVLVDTVRTIDGAEAFITEGGAR